MIWETAKEERTSLWANNNLFNKAKLPYLSINYIFIANVTGSEIRQRIDRDTVEQSTPQANNAKFTKKKLTLHKKIFFKYAVALLPHSSFRILSHQIAPESTSDDSSITGRQCTSKRTLKIFLVTLSIANSDNSTITVGKAVN